MDPVTVFSLIGTACGLTENIATCSSKLYKFIKSTKIVDESLQSLHQEVNCLNILVNNLRVSLNDESVKVYGTQLLWVAVEDGLSACHTTVERLLSKVTGIEDTQVCVNWTTQVAKQSKLSIHGDELRELRSQIHTHVAVIQAVLEMITLKVTVHTPNVVIKNLSSKIKSLDRRIQDLGAQRISTLRVDPRVVQKVERVKEAARSITHDAKSMISSRYDNLFTEHRRAAVVLRCGPSFPSNSFPDPIGQMTMYCLQSGHSQRRTQIVYALWLQRSGDVFLCGSRPLVLRDLRHGPHLYPGVHNRLAKMACLKR